MLAILLVEMEWLKENRTSEGAIQRQKYYKPVKTEDEVILTGDGIFFKKCQNYQKDNVIQSASEISDKLDAKQKEENKGKAFTGKEENEQKSVNLRNKAIKRQKGSL